MMTDFKKFIHNHHGLLSDALKHPSPASLQSYALTIEDMDPGDRRQLEQHLRTGCSRCKDTIQAFRQRAAYIAAAPEPCDD